MLPLNVQCFSSKCVTEQKASGAGQALHHPVKYSQTLFWGRTCLSRLSNCIMQHSFVPFGIQVTFIMIGGLQADTHWPILWISTKQHICTCSLSRACLHSCSSRWPGEGGPALWTISQYASTLDYPADNRCAVSIVSLFPFSYGSANGCLIYILPMEAEV